MAATLEFEEDWLGYKEKIVVLKHVGGNHIRINPKDADEVDGEGGTGEFARWQVEFKDGDRTRCMFKNVRSGKYLRLADEGKKVDVAGVGGGFCVFKMHSLGHGDFKLESAHWEGKYVAHRDGKVCVGTGGPFCKIEIFRGEEKKTTTEAFSKPYQFKMNNGVVLKHVEGKHLRADKDKSVATCHIDGGTGAFAQFDAELSDDKSTVSFKSRHSGKYLRLFDEGKKVDIGGVGGDWCPFKWHRVDEDEVKLESKHWPGKYVAVRKGEVCVGTGGPYCHIAVFREK